MSQRRSCDRQLTTCSLFWLGPVTNKELEEEVAHDHGLILKHKRLTLFQIPYPPPQPHPSPTPTPSRLHISVCLAKFTYTQSDVHTLPADLCVPSLPSLETFKLRFNTLTCHIAAHYTGGRDAVVALCSFSFSSDKKNATLPWNESSFLTG